MVLTKLLVVMKKLSKKPSRHSVVSTVRGAIPILEWLPQYDSASAIGDLIAGITVGLTLIPQSIAYAGLAGVDPEYGLYSSLCGGFIYACFGTVKDLNIAPTALISLLTYSYTKNAQHPQSAIFVCFAAGILQLLFGIFRLGFLVDFVSTPVVSGFTSAGALTIAASQLKSMFGLKYRAESFLEVVYKFLANIANIYWPDAVLSLFCCTLLIAFRELRRWGHPPTTQMTSLPKTLIWFVSVGRNAIVVILTAISAFFVASGLFSLGNPVMGTLPSFQAPFRNGMAFWEDLRTFGNGIVTIAMVSILSNMAIAKAFASGKQLLASQEMFTLGLCNLMGSFVGSYPVNASFSRAALNNASGARTTFGGVYTGLMVILSLTFLTKYFEFIPKAALASVIFCAVLHMVELQIFVDLWKSSRSDLIPLIITFGWSLCDNIERGILIGIVVDLIRFIWWSSRPKLHEVTQLCDDYEFIVLSLNGNCLFPVSEYVRTKIQTFVQASKSSPRINEQENGPKLRFIVLDCEKLVRLDYTSAKALGGLVKEYETWSENNVHIKFVFHRISNELKSKVDNLAKVEIITTESNTKLDTELHNFRTGCLNAIISTTNC